MVRGALVVIEGLDRAGKSTQCELLCDNLKKEGHKVKRMRFPNRTTPTGKSIDAYLKGESQVEDHVIHLLFSANRWEVATQIRDEIAEGTTLVIDRYSYSGAVYSAAKGNPKLSLEWAWQMEIGLPRPDLCLFLNIEPEEVEARGGFGDERYETIQIQSRVRKLFHDLFKVHCASDAVIVDAGRSVDLVQQDMLGAVRKTFTQGKLQRTLSSLESMNSLTTG